MTQHATICLGEARYITPDLPSDFSYSVPGHGCPLSFWCEGGQTSFPETQTYVHGEVRLYRVGIPGRSLPDLTLTFTEGSLTRAEDSATQGDKP